VMLNVGVCAQRADTIAKTMTVQIANKVTRRQLNFDFMVT